MLRLFSNNGKGVLNHSEQVIPTVLQKLPEGVSSGKPPASLPRPYRALQHKRPPHRAFQAKDKARSDSDGRVSEKKRTARPSYAGALLRRDRINKSDIIDVMLKKI